MAQTGPPMGQPAGGPPGPPTGRPQHKSFVGPILLIVLGVCFLVANLRPDFDPWPILARYWPLILVFVGLGMIWDNYYKREHSGQPRPWISGTSVAWIVILAFFVLAVWHGGATRHRGWDWDQRHFPTNAHSLHDSQTVDVQDAKSVSAELRLGAGTLTLSGGSDHLLDADFRYNSFTGKPSVDYEVSGDHGQLTLTQGLENHAHFGNDDNDWNLRLGDNVPISLKVNMGAGESNLNLNGLDLSRLDIQMGVGELHLDLAGERSNNLEATIQGGVGSATIHLPKTVGVRVNASGGIGAVDAHGLKRDGDAYVNDAYGKTAGSIDLTIHGGVGKINLLED